MRRDVGAIHKTVNRTESHLFQNSKIILFLINKIFQKNFVKKDNVFTQSKPIAQSQGSGWSVGARGEPHHPNSHPITQKLNAQRAQALRQIHHYMNPRMVSHFSYVGLRNTRKIACFGLLIIFFFFFKIHLSSNIYIYIYINKWSC